MAETAKKITKKDKFNTIAHILNSAEETGIQLVDEGYTYGMLREFVEGEIAILDMRAENARKRAEKKRADGDILREKVLEQIPHDRLISIDEIVAAINDPDVNRSMVISRLAQLGENGTNQIIKEPLKADNAPKNSRTLGYKRID